MDIAGTAQAITQLRGAVRRLDRDDQDVIDLIVFVCDTIGKSNPELRSAFTKAALERLESEFPRGERSGLAPETVDREKLRYGLRQIAKLADR